MQEFPAIAFRDQSGGMMSSPDDSMIPDSAAKLSVNFRHHMIGQAIQRNGYSKIGGTVESGKDCDGLAWFQNAAGTRNRIVAAYNGTNYAWDGSGWSSVGAGMTAGLRVRYENFIDLVFRVGGGLGTKSWNGEVASSFGTSQLTGAPAGKLILLYKSRLYIAGDSTYPDRLYRSSIPSVTGNLTWTTSTDYLDINPSDGDNITALAKTGTLMLIFKRNYIYRWNGTATDAEPVINVGTVSQESVANVNGTIYFFNPRGIFSTDGGVPVEVSRPIKDWIDAIPAANYDGMCAFSDGDRYGLFVGDVTLNGRTFTNVVIEYDTNVKCWQVHCLAHPFRCFANARTAAGTDFVAGGKESNVETMFSGNTDDGSPITFEHETRKIDFDGLHTQKEITAGAFYLSGCPALFEAIPDVGNRVALGTASGAITAFKGRSVKGNAISFKISGTNSSTPAVWRGFNIVSSRSLGFVTK
jgi:hypothetical protein